MTIPPKMRAAGKTIMESVREWLPTVKHRLTPDEMDLAIYLRGNKVLYEALTNVVHAPIEARKGLPVSKEPNDSMIIRARDNELMLLLRKLEFIYQSPVIEQVEAADEGEQPDS